MKEEQINSIKKLITDILIYSDDSLNIIHNYYVKTGLHLPLVKLLRDLKMDAKVQNNEDLVLKIDNMRKDVTAYLYWRIDHADKPAAQILEDLIHLADEITDTQKIYTLAESILGLWVTIRLLAKNEYYETSNFVINEIEKLFKVIDQNKSVLSDTSRTQMMGMNDQLAQLDALFQKKDTQQIMLLTSVLGPAVPD